MSDKPVYRQATAEDSHVIARMMDIFSDGIALIEWTEAVQAAGERTALDIGAGIYASETGDYSYRNCCIAEVTDRRVGMLLGFPMPARDPSDDASASALDSCKWPGNWLDSAAISN